MLSFILSGSKENRFLKKTLLASSFALCFASNFGFADSFPDIMQDKDSWIYKKINSTKDEFIKKIEKDVNAAFKEAVIDKLIEKMTAEFGEEIGKTLTSFIGVGPFFSFAMLAAGGGGPSETQIMMQVLLEAINDARDEIIDAVEQNFQDETESDLNALILSLDIYNSRDEAARKMEYQLLSDMSYYASRIKKRLEQKSSKAVDNSHLYMLISGLHIEIEKQYTHWLTLHIDPAASAEKLKGEFDGVLDVIVKDNFAFLNEGTIGSLSSWKASFESSFNEKVEFVGYVPAGEIPAGRSHDDAYYFSYKFNEKPIKFKVLGGVGCTQAFRHYYVYDAVGNQAGKIIGGCKTSVSGQLSLVQKNIGVAVTSHKNDVNSFNKYVLDGYVPIREIYDLWWKLAFDMERPKSEVDIFVSDLVAASAPKSCKQSGRAGEYLGNTSLVPKEILIELGATYCLPCGYFTQEADGGSTWPFVPGPMHSFYCSLE